MEKQELKDLVSKLVDAFDLESKSKQGIVDGEVLKEKLTDWMVVNTKVDLETRRQNFIKELSVYKEEYGSNLLNKFYAYWSATKGASLKMAFEKEKSFDMKLRLETFKRNETKFNLINLTK